jgi:UDP-glucose 4-epimerase
MRSAIVTGASGFVGSQLVKELLSYGVEVYAVVRKDTPLRYALPSNPGLHIIACNMSEYASLPDLIPSSAVDVFYHLAWEGSAGPLRANTKVQLDNVLHTVEAVQAANVMQCGRFCGAGSIMETEAIAYIPQNGSHPNKSYIYSTAKLTAHFMAKTTAQDLGIPFVWGIISNAYGVGEISPRFINTTLAKLLHASEADFTEGVQIYDFVNISDMAHAFYLLGESGKSNTAYYIGSGQPRPIREYVEIMRDLVAPHVALHFGAVPFNGVCLPMETFDISMLTEDTGFRPVISFEDGIRMTAQWLKEAEERDT